VTAQLNDTYIEEGVDALTLLTPLIEKRRAIIVGVIVLSLAVGVVAFLMPRKYKAEVFLTPVLNSRSSSALGGIAALAGATLQTGYQLTPARMVELIRSRAVLAGVGLSTIRQGASEKIIDRVLDKRYDRNDSEDIAKHITKLLSTNTNKETGTIQVAIEHPDSALARLIAGRVVDSASQIFVRTSKAQAQQLRVAQETRVDNAAAALTNAEERLRQFKDQNRATPAFSAAGVEQERLSRQIRFAEDVYTQAATDREAAYARELEATPTVVVQDPLPKELPKVRKHVFLKMGITAVVSLIMLSLGVLLTDLTRRRLERTDAESTRFRKAMSSLPRIRKRTTRAV
jgi:capsule polysaccharide export protein KpsE/RkpR